MKRGLKMGVNEAVFSEILANAVEQGASDIFISAEVPVYWRRAGQLEPLLEYTASSDDIAGLFSVVADENIKKQFSFCREVDFTWSDDNARFRIHLYSRLGKPAFAIRVLAGVLPCLAGLGQAGRARDFLGYESGLFLVTGATGAGKTTTVAAMLAEYNNSRDYHILTLEDPVEYTYPSGRCLFSQQELGKDFLDYRQGIISAMRENPDVIMISELRDVGACEATLSAASSGHYVIATMHTGGAVETVERFISMFDSSRQRLAQSMLADSLRGICSQKLISGSGYEQYCVAEILHTNNAVKNIIRSGKYEQLTSVMQSGGNWGMQTMEMGEERFRKAVCAS